MLSPYSYFGRRFVTADIPAQQSFGERLAAFRRSLSGEDRRSLLGMLAFIVLLHVVGFGVLFGLVVPKHWVRQKLLWRVWPAGAPSATGCPIQ